MTDWVEEADCRTVDPDLWHTEQNGPRGAQDVREAKRICSGCPVRAQCLDYAMRREDGTPASGRHGIYGGLDGDERHALQCELDEQVAA